MAGKKQGGPSERTRRLLFGSAVYCAFPKCEMRVVVFIDGKPNPGAEVAHIRSAEHGGPRHECDYNGVHEFDNLLLLCSLHHGHVDYHWRDYDINLLCKWKEMQQKQVGERVSNEYLDALLSELDRLREQNRTQQRGALFVELVGGLGLTESSPHPVFWQGMRNLKIARRDGETYLGVRVANRNPEDASVLATGVEFDYGIPNPMYFFPTRLDAAEGVSQEAFQLAADQTRTHFTSTPALGHCLRILNKETGSLTTRIRGWIALELGERVYSPWEPLQDVVNELVGPRGRG